MSTDLIQAKYEELDSIASRFQQRAELIEELHRRIQRSVQVLEQGDWEGKGSAAFFAEMNADMYPAIQRLSAALAEAHSVTRVISKVIENAEEEAANVFHGSSDSGIVLASPIADAGVGVTSTPTGPDSSGPIQIGDPQRPIIQHDNGFLDKFSPREPTFSDHANLLKWKAKLEGAEVIRLDLVDGLAAYRHFLEGNGVDRHINYERFLLNDPSGQKALRNLIIDTQRHVEVIGEGRDSFQITSDAYNIGGKDARFPYPETENWQKALGGHNVWTSANVEATGEPPNRTYQMEITLHMEDRYNFNPGQSDIATGIPDSDNGIFELTGLARQYMNYGEVNRYVTWTEGDIANAQITDPDDSRNRKPSDNRRARNRI